MKLFLCVAAFVATAILARYADASDKPRPPPKPIVCSAYRVIEPGLAVCSDAKKPFIMRQFAEVKVGESVVLVGFR